MAKRTEAEQNTGAGATRRPIGGGGPEPGRSDGTGQHPRRRRVPARLLLFLLALAVLAHVAAAPAGPDPREEQPDPGLTRLLEADLPDCEDVLFGVAVKHLPTGRAAFRNAEVPFESASLLKLPLLFEAHRQRALGLLSFGETLAITERHLEISVGESSVVPGDALGLGDALERIITFSDNAPAVALVDRLGNRRVNLTMEELGLLETAVDWESTTSARDMAGFFEMLARLEGVDAEASREMLSLLLRQRINDRLPRLLPGDTPIAHKTGDLPGIIHDAGLLYTPAGPVAIAVLAAFPGDDPGVRGAMAHLAADVYEYARAGGFGRPFAPPLLWDPDLDARLRPLVASGAGRLGLAVKHLGTGQAVLVDADREWSSPALHRRVQGEVEELSEEIFAPDPELATWTTSPRRLLGLVERAYRPDAASPPGLYRLLSAHPPAGSTLAALPPASVVAYLGGEEGETRQEAAVVRSGGALYALALFSEGPSWPDPARLAAAAEEHFRRCSWGAQEDPAGCRP